MLAQLKRFIWILISSQENNPVRHVYVEPVFLILFQPNMGLFKDCYHHMTDAGVDSTASNTLLIFLTLTVSLFVTIFTAFYCLPVLSSAVCLWCFRLRMVWLEDVGVDVQVCRSKCWKKRDDNGIIKHAETVTLHFQRPAEDAADHE